MYLKLKLTQENSKTTRLETKIRVNILKQQYDVIISNNGMRIASFIEFRQQSTGSYLQ